MNSKQSDRRGFLKDSAALAGMAVGTMRFAKGQTPSSETSKAPPADWHAYGERSRFVNSIRSGSAIRLTPLQDSMGIITPAALHYMNNHGYEPPRDIDPRQHRLLLHGMVDRPLIFTMEELKGLPSVSRVHFIECGSNSSPTNAPGKTVQERHGWTSCSEWTGVPLSLLLKEAGVQNGARWIVPEGLGGGKLTLSIPMEKAMDDVLVAYGQNGEPVRPENGFPLRLVVPGFEGVNNIKWLRRIKVVDQPYFAKLEAPNHTSLRLDGKARWLQFSLGPKSVITFPSGEQHLSARGFYEITGLAWSGFGSVRKVEVSTDGGRTWKEAQIQGPVHRIAHTRFHFAWNWNGEEAVLQSRCTDDQGVVQPSLSELAKIWNVDSEYWLTTTNSVMRFNAIQPWRVARDGSVHDAMFKSTPIHRHQREGCGGCA